MKKHLSHTKKIFGTIPNNGFKSIKHQHMVTFCLIFVRLFFSYLLRFLVFFFFLYITSHKSTINRKRKHYSNFNVCFKNENVFSKCFQKAQNFRKNKYANAISHTKEIKNKK